MFKALIYTPNQQNVRR